MVKLGSSGKYLKVDDVQVGEEIKFLSEGEWVENEKYKYPDGNPRMDFICDVEHKGEKKRWRLNKTNRDILLAAWGNETKEWLNKSAKVELENVLIGGKKMKMIVLNAGKKVEEHPWDE
jgi:hypothetical protein